MGALSKLEKPSALDALQLLDEDGWREVFRKLNGEDLLNCRKVCKPFRKVLDEHEFQMKWGFHLVLPLLFDYLKTNVSVEFNGQMMEGHWTSWRDLLSLRKTCRSWRHSVDKHATEYKSIEEHEEPERMFDKPLAARFFSLEEIEAFQRLFDGCSVNPFPSRTVYISNMPSFVQPPELRIRDRHLQNRMQLAYVEKIGDLLEQFGKYIGKLELFFQPGFAVEPLTLYDLMKRITPHLSTLKTFIIINKREEGLDRNIDSYQQEAMAALIQQNPVAKMPKLEELYIDNLDANDAKLKNHLLKKHARQLSRLNKLNEEGLLKEVGIQRFKNLRELSYKLSGHEDTLQLLRLLESPLKLLKVELMIVFSMQQLNWNVDKVLSNIKHLPVERLEIRLGVVTVQGGLEFVESSLHPKEYINTSIKQLFLLLCVRNEGHISFNFLEALKGLEILELEFLQSLLFKTTHPKGFVREVVKLNEYYLDEESKGAPYRSNVWEKVPSLKMMTVKRPRDLECGDGPQKLLTYTRKKYEEVKKKCLEMVCAIISSKNCS